MPGGPVLHHREHFAGSGWPGALRVAWRVVDRGDAEDGRGERLLELEALWFGTAGLVEWVDHLERRQVVAV